MLLEPVIDVAGLAFGSGLVSVMMNRLMLLDYSGTLKTTESENTNEWVERGSEEAYGAQEAVFVMICLQRDQGNHVELDGNPKEIQAN